MRPGLPRGGASDDRLGRWLALLLVPTALLTEPVAALPLRTYFFRDFTATFLPLRVFAARELREGRMAFWNPFVFEGSFQLPALYPPDLLLALWPSPVFASWLLSLHLPLAALAACWLARELGASRGGGFVAGATYALGGLALSSLNLYVFLQALALAPLVVGLTRRAAREEGTTRDAILAAVVLALALSTLAVEFVGQALLAGLALALFERPRLEGAKRLVLVVALGLGLCALPVSLTLGLLAETARGAGFAREVALGNAVHPAVFLQTLLPHLFGLPQAPAEAWWGGRFFSKGLPYFLTLYLGPIALSLAAVGVGALPRRARAVLVGLCVLALWYSLGEWGGLAPLLLRVPGWASLRFPCKALLLPYLTVALAAGFGFDRLRRRADDWTLLLAPVGAAAVIAVVVAAVLRVAPSSVVAWSGVDSSYWPTVVGVVRGDALLLLVMAAVAGGLVLAVRRGLVKPAPAAALLAALLVVDLVRAGAGINRQVSPSFFEPLPEIAAMPLHDPDGGRVFSYGVDQSPAFLAFLARGGAETTLVGSYIYRQILGPYVNVLDRLPVPEGNDLTGFAPRERELGPNLYAPSEFPKLLPWLRQAAVSRILTLDPLTHPTLVPLGVASADLPPGLAIRLYAIDRPLPIARLACRVVLEPDPERALRRPYAPDFDPQRDVVLAEGEEARCHHGRARQVDSAPGEERYEVDADGEGYLVVRASYARGWHAVVDADPAPVLLADGKHRAVPLPPGRHVVVLRYDPPGLGAGLALCALAVLLSGTLWIVSAGSRR